VERRRRQHDDRRLAAKIEVHALEMRAAAGGDSRLPARTLAVTDTIAGTS